MRCKLILKGVSPMARTRKTYTPEFKLAAVKMIFEQKLSVAEVARRLGVGENLIHNWKKAVAKDGSNAFPGSGHLTPQEEELRKLRAEVRRLEQERDILKKATAFFASQTN
jgi:transposase